MRSAPPRAKPRLDFFLLACDEGATSATDARPRRVLDTVSQRDESLAQERGALGSDLLEDSDSPREVEEIELRVWTQIGLVKEPQHV